MAEPTHPGAPWSGEPPLGLPPGPSSAWAETETHFLDRLSVVHRYRRVVLTVLALVMVGAVVQTFTTVPL